MSQPTANVSAVGQGIPGYSGIHAYEVWSPLAIPSLALWLDGRRRVFNSVGPDVPATNGQTVRRWANSANPGTFDANQTIAASQPLYDLPNDSLVFDGVDDFFSTSATITGNDWCIVFIWDLDNIIPGSRFISLQNSADAGGDFNTTTSATILYLVDSISFYQNLGSLVSYVFPTSGYFVGILNVTPSGSSLWVNGVETLGATCNAGLNANTIRIGATDESGLARFISGSNSQTLFYTSSLTTPQISQLQTWATTL